MKIHSKAVVSAKENEMSALVESLRSALSSSEVSGAELNKRQMVSQTIYSEKTPYCEIDPSKVRLATDYLSAFLRELKREFGK